MAFHSILFERTDDGAKKEVSEAPDFFSDLNLDQIIDAITAGKPEYNLNPFFYNSLTDVHAMEYRQEIMQDVENNILFENIGSFARKMRDMRQHLTQVGKLYYKLQKQAWFLDAVEIYCEAINSFAHEIAALALKSRGFLAFREYLTDYAQSEPFMLLTAETKRVKADLGTVQYCVLIKGDTLNVRKYEAETDYSAGVEGTFEKFKQGAVQDYRVKFPTWPEMNHIEAKALEFVAELYPDVFLNLENYCAKNSNYLDETIRIFDREIQFYIAYLEYAARFKRAGFKFCYPRVSDQSKEVHNYEGFDLALANKLVGEKSAVVCNDFYLKGKERIIVVSGPNQGGKTTFARTFGQLHYLASLGCPVPGREAQLFLFEKLFTHFEREENIETLRGKLEDDLVRIHDILNRATPNSIIIMNEIFTSTTLQDAVFLSKAIMEKITELDLLCVWVTFIDELASFGEQTVSMVSIVVPGTPVLRTYKVLRRSADGLAHAISIAKKYRVTYDSLAERLKS